MNKIKYQNIKHAYLYWCYPYQDILCLPENSCRVFGLTAGGSIAADWASYFHFCSASLWLSGCVVSKCLNRSLVSQLCGLVHITVFLFTDVDVCVLLLVRIQQSCDMGWLMSGLGKHANILQNYSKWKKLIQPPIFFIYNIGIKLKKWVIPND